jgi:hypothetical protein
VNTDAKENSGQVTTVMETMKEFFGVDKFATTNLTPRYRELTNEQQNITNNNQRITPQQEIPKELSIKANIVENKTQQEQTQHLDNIRQNTYVALGLSKDLNENIKNQNIQNKKPNVVNQPKVDEKPPIVPPPVVNLTPPDNGPKQLFDYTKSKTETQEAFTNALLNNNKKIPSIDPKKDNEEISTSKENKSNLIKIDDFTTDVILTEMTRMVDENINGFENLVKNNSKLIEGYHKEYGFVSEKLNGFEEIPSYFDQTFKKTNTVEVENDYTDIVKNTKQNNFVTKDDLDKYMKPTEKVVEKETTKVSDGKITIKHDVNVTSQPIVDAFSREILKNPDLVKSAFNVDPRDYLYVNP